MEDSASEMSDWEVLSAPGGDDDDDVLVSGDGGDVLHDHFALVPSAAASLAGFSSEGSWSEPASDDEGRGEGLDLVRTSDWVSEGGLDLAVEDWGVQLQVGGVDATGESSVLPAAVACAAAAWGSEERRDEAVNEEVEQERDAAHGCGELESVTQLEHHGTGESLGSDATVVADVPPLESLENSDVRLEDGGVDAARGSSLLEADATVVADVPLLESLENSNVRLEDEGVDVARGSSLLEADAVSHAMGIAEEEPEQGRNSDAATGCDESDGEAKDGSLPLAQAPGTGDEERQAVVWWRLPLRLLHYCAWKMKPVWSFSIAAALLGLVVLGRRMYRIRRKARGLPQIKIAFDDKRASQFADRAARLNEAFFLAKRIPMLRTSSGAALPWSMVQER